MATLQIVFPLSVMGAAEALLLITASHEYSMLCQECTDARAQAAFLALRRPQIPLEDPQDFECPVRDPTADELLWSHVTYYSSCPLFATPSGADSGSPQDLHHIVDKALESSLLAL